MEADSLVETLRDVDFLQGINDEHLQSIASVARLVDIDESKVIFREGEPATNVFLIANGNVSLEISAPGVGRRRILTVGKGELLGWSPVLEQCRLTAPKWLTR